MKKTIILFIVIAFAMPSFPQVMPEAFIGQLPAIPKGTCSLNREQRDQFIERVDELLQAIDEEQTRRDENISADADANKNIAMNAAAARYGISQAEMQKLQDPKTSEAEKMAIVNKMSSQKNNISVGEAKSVSNMNEAGREAWGQSVATEQMANAQADPEATKSDQNTTKKIYDLTMAQKHLNDSLTAIANGISAEFSEIKDDPEGKKMVENIEKWNSEYMNSMGIGSDSELEARIKAEKEKYCATFTPRYIAVLNRYESFTKASIQPYYRLERISNKLSKLQNGVELYKEPGAMGIASVKSYLDELKNIFQFNLNN
ncbi:MAG TPA: hypothetical protein PKH02_01080 [Bacteroidales bacterium]|nr:hypothetical protein [Bacteroidales bacterium]HPT11912.1 hypothetical protein [Bacteroidales bacterium]